MNVLKSHLQITISTLLPRGRQPTRNRSADRRGSQDHPPLGPGKFPHGHRLPGACRANSRTPATGTARLDLPNLTVRGSSSRSPADATPKRFVRPLKRREHERFDVLDCAPGEEAQVDFGLGTLTLTANGKYRSLPVRDDPQVLMPRDGG